MSWRAHSTKVIRDVIRENPTLDESTLRKKISEAYPFGERAHHPYKIWLSEVKLQVALHFRKPLQVRASIAPVQQDPNQASLI